MSDPTEMSFAKRATSSDDAKPGGPNWPLIIGGGCAFLTLLICIGTGVLGWMAYTRTRDAVVRVQEGLQKDVQIKEDLKKAGKAMENASNRIKSTDNLKNIIMAMHGYHDANKRLPDHASLEPNTGKPLLSWRVAVLPYLGEEPLYRQIRQDEAWDSPHNKQFWTKIPEVYELPGKPLYGNTYYQVFVGRDSAFPKAEGPQFISPKITLIGITDGSSNTIFVVEAANPVNWMKPDDIPFEKSPTGVPLSVVGNHWGNDSFFAVMGDGRVRYFPRARTSPQNLQQFITRNGNEVVRLPD